VRIGPGLLVTAAFVGPGTITTASIAGAGYGFTLVWALVFSVVTTIILQEMTGRLGIVTGEGVSEAIRRSLINPWFRYPLLLLVVIGIGLGNAAYQTGNILGASVGAESLTGITLPFWVVFLSVVAAVLLGTGWYRLIESTLIVLVLTMSVVFVSAMLLQPPDLGDILLGLRPSIPDGATLSVIALIGTTVVPYNLFLHANAVRNKWQDVPIEQALRESRKDLVFSLTLGGLLTLAIISTASTAFFGSNVSLTASNLVGQLEPVLGEWSRYLVATGLLSAGLTSAVTAPLAAGIAVCGAMGWSTELSSKGFRSVAAIVLLSGAAFAVLQEVPLTAIQLAQYANGLLLPLLAGLLVWVMNQAVLKQYQNSPVKNLFGVTVILIAAFLGWNKLF